MPARAVEHPDDAAGRMAHADLVEKALPTLGVDVWQAQRVQLAADPIYRAVGIGCTRGSA